MLGLVARFNVCIVLVTDSWRGAPDAPLGRKPWEQIEKRPELDGRREGGYREAMGQRSANLRASRKMLGAMNKRYHKILINISIVA